MINNNEFIYLEIDGKILLVDNEGNGPKIPEMGRKDILDNSIIRLPTKDEALEICEKWDFKRINKIRIRNEEYVVEYGMPIIKWPENWAWKDSVISDNCVDPLAREVVYRTMHRVVSKVIITNSKNELLMQKISRGFFKGYWTLPGGYVDYDEHPRDAAQREALEEMGINIEIPDKIGENGEIVSGNDSYIVQSKIFNSEGINWVSFTYKCEGEFDKNELIPKEDEIEKIEWFTKEQALNLAVSEFDIEALKKIQ